eukprot:gene45220-60394_t
MGIAPAVVDIAGTGITTETEIAPVTNDNTGTTATTAADIFTAGAAVLSMTVEWTGVMTRILNGGFEETISAGSPLVGLFKNLPPDIAFRDAMDQVLSTSMIPEMEIDVLTVDVNVALQLAVQAKDSNPAAAGLNMDEIAAIK